MFLHAYLDGRYEDALAEAKRINLPDVVYSHVTLAMAYGQLGAMDEARAAVDRIREIDPNFGDHVIADQEKRNLHPDLIAAIAEGLKQAGLDVTVPGSVVDGVERSF